jgi:integrase
MLPALANAPSSAPEPDGLLAGYLATLRSRGAGNSAFTAGARAFLRRWPDPQAWAAQPLPARLRMWSSTRPLLNHLMLFGHLRPGYDYLLERKLPAVLREARTSPLAADLDRFLAAALALGFTDKTAAGMASQVLMRMLIQTGHGLAELTEPDLAEFAQAIGERETVHGKPFKHYRTALAATRTVLYHLDAAVAAPVKNTAHLKLPAGHQFIGVPEPVAASLARYLECAAGTRTASTVAHIAGRLGHFVRFVADLDPALDSLADLDRQRHIEPYLAETAAALNPRTGEPLSASERRSRILTVGRMIDDVIEWGWTDAPARRLIFPRDVPRLPRPLPRYLPADADRRLTAALHASPNRLRADALLLLRATGMRIGELRDLELDCVHEVPGAGAWLKVPLGKLDSERMVPIDEETLTLLDRIVEHRSSGRPLPHPRTGKPVDFLLTHQGRRISIDTQRARPRRRRRRPGRGDTPPAPTHLRHRPGQLRSLPAGPDGTARPRLGRDEPALRPPVRLHRARRLRKGPHPGQVPPRPSPARAHPAPAYRNHRWPTRLAASAADQGTARRRLLPTHRGPGRLLIREYLRALPEPSNRRDVPADPGRPTRRRRNTGCRRPSARLDHRSQPPHRPRRAARPAHHHGRGRRMNTTLAARVEQACRELATTGEPITFGSVAERADIGRATLYRRPELRALVEEHRQRERDALTLTGLAVQIDQLRGALEAVAANVRRHEEQLRQLTRTTRNKPE